MKENEVKIIRASSSKEWREELISFGNIDVCYLPEYHLAYENVLKDAKAIMWSFENEDNKFCYPFFISQIKLTNDEKSIRTPYFDISSVYGYSGPLSTSVDSNFLSLAWKNFDSWAKKKKIINEFIRFSFSPDNRVFAHPETEVLFNRKSAVFNLPDQKDKILKDLGPKTRNMIKKAQKLDLFVKKLDFLKYKKEFMQIYLESMEYNSAKDFFFYSDEYFLSLGKMKTNEISLYGVFDGKDLISAAIILKSGKNSLYHLGCTKKKYLSSGANNLCLFQASLDLSKEGFRLFNFGGGRTINPDDPLLKFKKNNSNELVDFFIGKRILDKEAYNYILNQWKEMNGINKTSINLQFYKD